MDYKEYKTWLDGLNNNQQTPMTESDMRVKDYLVHSMEDDTLRKMMMLGLVQTGAIDSKLANICIMKNLMR